MLELALGRKLMNISFSNVNPPKLCVLRSLLRLYTFRDRIWNWLWQNDELHLEIARNKGYTVLDSE